MSALAPLVDPATAGNGLAVTGSDPQAIPPPQSLVPANMQLSANPMLPAHPLGAYTDAQYESQDAILRNTIAKQYADLLQQLGYRDNAGNFIMGSVETGANKQKQELGVQQRLAAQGVTDQAQREGTLFSGMRGTLQARAEDPYVRQQADLAASTPLTIQQLYEHASGLTNDYVLGQNQQLAEAASRAAAGITANPPGGAGGAAAPVAPPVDPNAGASVAPVTDLSTDALVAPGMVHPPPLGTYGGVTYLAAPTALGSTPAAPAPQVLSPAQQAANAMATQGLTYRPGVGQAIAT